MRLHDVAFDASGQLQFPAHRHRERRSRFSDYLALARDIIDEARAGIPCQTPAFNADFEALRWFLLPGEVPSTPPSGATV